MFICRATSKGERISNGSRFNVNGAYGAVKFWNQWLSFGQILQWWGPGYEGSLIRGDAMRPMTGFLMQRAEQAAPEIWWLRWVGPWQYQISASQMNQYIAVPHAKIIGGRFTFSPFQSLELGASRIMQWGREGRPESLSNFWDGLTGKTIPPQTIPMNRVTNWLGSILSSNSSPLLAGR